MTKPNKPSIGRPTLRRLAMIVAPTIVVLTIIMPIAYKTINPAPPNKIIIATSDGEGDYQAYAKQYQEIIKQDGVDLVIRPSTGAMENLKLLNDPKSDVEVGFVEDGLGSDDESPDLSSLGSLYYEPIWVFYHNGKVLTRFSQLIGKKIAIGRDGGGTRVITTRLLNASGITDKNSHFVNIGWQEAASALENGSIDAAFFLATPEETIIKDMMENPKLRLMDVEQAEAITRQIPFLHHLVLPEGAVDLKRNLPRQEVHLVSPTATLLARDSLHPALAYLLLKAAAQVHGEPGILEKKGEFPIDKDYEFPLSDEAKSYYKNGAPFWQRYLPFWLANLMERFILVIIPTIALLIPVLKLFPRLQTWRLKSKIYQRYGELKYLETQIQLNKDHSQYGEYLKKLDGIEERVNAMKLPIDYAEHTYSLRGHIQFVRERLKSDLNMPAAIESDSAKS